MIRTKQTIDQVTEAVRSSSGIKVLIAKRLGVSRFTVDNYLKRWPTVRQVYVEEVEAVGDFAESVIIQAIKSSDVETAKWYCRVKLKNRGYSDRTEHTGADGQAILIKEVIIERHAAPLTPASFEGAPVPPDPTTPAPSGRLVPAKTSHDFVLEFDIPHRGEGANA